MVDRADEVSPRTESVINDHRDTSLMCNRHNLLEVGDIVLGIANALKLPLISPPPPLKIFKTHINSLRLIINRLSEVLRTIPIDELRLDAQAREKHFELVVCASVQIRRSNDIISSMCERSNGDELGRLARRRG